MKPTYIVKSVAANLLRRYATAWYCCNGLTKISGTGNGKGVTTGLEHCAGCALSFIVNQRCHQGYRAANHCCDELIVVEVEEAAVMVVAIMEALKSISEFKQIIAL